MPTARVAPAVCPGSSEPSDSVAEAAHEFGHVRVDVGRRDAGRHAGSCTGHAFVRIELGNMSDVGDFAVARPHSDVLQDHGEGAILAGHRAALHDCLGPAAKGPAPRKTFTFGSSTRAKTYMRGRACNGRRVGPFLQ